MLERLYEALGMIIADLSLISTMRTLRPDIRAYRSRISPRSRTRVRRQRKQEPKTKPAVSRLYMALIGLCALTQPDRHPQPTAPSRTSAKGFARPLFRTFQILPFARKDGRRHCFEKRSVIMSHLKYEIERIGHVSLCASVILPIEGGHYQNSRQQYFQINQTCRCSFFTLNSLKQHENTDKNSN